MTPKRDPMKKTNIQPSASRGGRKLRNDVIFLTVLLLAVAVLALLYFLLREEGNTVVVTVDGKRFSTYSLSEDRVVEIRTGEGGTELNRLVIRDGEALVETATCPDGICASHKPISRDGESIVCLPHKLVITVRRTAPADGPDVVA